MSWKLGIYVTCAYYIFIIGKMESYLAFFTCIFRKVFLPAFVEINFFDYHSDFKKK